MHKLCGSSFIFKKVTPLDSAAVLKINRYDGGQHWLENHSFWVCTEVLLENRNKCFILEDTSQKVDNIYRATCFAFSCYRPFAWWRHFATTTRILFVFPFIFKFGNPSEGFERIVITDLMSSILKDLFCAQEQAKSQFSCQLLTQMFTLLIFRQKLNRLSLALVLIARHSVFPTEYILQSS